MTREHDSERAPTEALQIGVANNKALRTSGESFTF
jgi:hypothetical protein